MSISPDDFLMGGGGVPSAKFEHPGASITGTIADLAVRQQTDVRDRTPLTWPNGDPKMQLVVTLNTSLRDPSIEDDDGQRRVYIKGKRLTDATRDAVKAVGAKGLEIGGTLTVTYIKDGAPAGVGISPPKEYKVVYERPNASAAFLGTDTAAPSPAPQPAPAAAEAPNEAALQAALANLDPKVLALLAQAGKTG